MSQRADGSRCGPSGPLTLPGSCASGRSPSATTERATPTPAGAWFRISFSWRGRDDENDRNTRWAAQVNVLVVLLKVILAVWVLRAANAALSLALVPRLARAPRRKEGAPLVSI